MGGLVSGGGVGGIEVGLRNTARAGNRGRGGRCARSSVEGELLGSGVCSGFRGSGIESEEHCGRDWRLTLLCCRLTLSHHRLPSIRKHTLSLAPSLHPPPSPPPLAPDPFPPPRSNHAAERIVPCAPPARAFQRPTTCSPIARHARHSAPATGRSSTHRPSCPLLVPVCPSAPARPVRPMRCT